MPPSPHTTSTMTLQQLAYFIAAIEHGTLSKAAENLDISQPSLSEQIIRLDIGASSGALS